MNRIEPLTPPYSEAVEASLKKWMPPGSPVEPLVLFRTLQRHEALAERLRGLGALFLGRPSVSLRERELVILRTCWRCGAEYEWGVHVTAFAALAELDAQAVLQTTRERPEAGAGDALLLRFADELHATSSVGDATWAALRERFTEAQVLELLALAGFYRLLSGVMNAAQLPLEPWAARFP